MNKKIGKIIVILLTIFLLLGGIGFYLLLNMVSSKPDTDKKKIREEMINYAEQKFDKDLKLIDFKVERNNDFEGVPGNHALIMETKDGHIVHFYLSNDVIDKNSDFNVNDIYDNYAISFFEDIARNHITSLYPNLKDYLKEDALFDEDRVRMGISTDNGDIPYDAYIEAKAKKEGKLIGDYIREHEKELIKEYVSIDAVLYPENGAFNVKQEYQEEFYEVYKQLTDKFDESFILNIIIAVYDEKESSYVDLFDSENKKAFSKEEVFERFKNYDTYKQLNEW